MYYGYDIKVGYYGRLPNGKWMLFPTEREYSEYINEFYKED